VGSGPIPKTALIAFLSLSSSLLFFFPVARFWCAPLFRSCFFPCSFFSPFSPNPFCGWPASPAAVRIGSPIVPIACASCYMLDLSTFLLLCEFAAPPGGPAVQGPGANSEN
jgi:hypothetical protein